MTAPTPNATPTLHQALADLPDSADGIAATFIERGIKGVPEDDGCCPVANYLTGLGFDGVTVGLSQIDAYEAGDTYARQYTPNAISAFIARFDGGEWPELVSDPDAAS